MGVLYMVHAVALVDDLGLKDHFQSAKAFYKAADAQYLQVGGRLSL